MTSNQQKANLFVLAAALVLGAVFSAVSLHKSATILKGCHVNLAIVGPLTPAPRPGRYPVTNTQKSAMTASDNGNVKLAASGPLTPAPRPGRYPRVQSLAQAPSTLS